VRINGAYFMFCTWERLWGETLDVTFCQIIKTIPTGHGKEREERKKQKNASANNFKGKGEKNNEENGRKGRNVCKYGFRSSKRASEVEGNNRQEGRETERGKKQGCVFFTPGERKGRRPRGKNAKGKVKSRGCQKAGTRGDGR